MLWTRRVALLVMSHFSGRTKDKVIQHAIQSSSRSSPHEDVELERDCVATSGTYIYTESTTYSPSMAYQHRPVLFPTSQASRFVELSNMTYYSDLLATYLPSPSRCSRPSKLVMSIMGLYSSYPVYLCTSTQFLPSRLGSSLQVLQQRQTLVGLPELQLSTCCR